MKKNLLVFLISLVFLLTACNPSTPILTDANGNPIPTTENGEPVIEYTAIDVSQLFSDRDYEINYNPSQCTAISLQGSTASGGAVGINGSTVTISKEGSYILSGNLSDGMILVDSDKENKIQLILNGVDIHSETSAPIYIKQADKVFITLAEGSNNTLSCGSSYVAIDENNIDSAIFSKDDLTLNGNGKLTISSPAGHGIVSKDDLRITGGTYHITAAEHGLVGQDALSIANGNFTITSGKDGIHGENDEDATLGAVYIGTGSYTLDTDGDGISASSSLYVSDGSFNILCGGGSEYGEEHTSDMFGGGMGGPGGMGGMGGRPGKNNNYSEIAPTTTEDTVSTKGLKSTGPMTVLGGDFLINTADDGLHSNNSLTVAGGQYQIAAGDDGFHADEALSIGGGDITITESYEGLEGLSITITGGNITLKASDDGINAAGGNDQSGFGGKPGGMGGRPGMGGDHFGSSSDSFITISGGKLFIDADGDGIDSNGNLTFSGGYTVVEGPTNGGNGPLDYGGSGSLSGGTVMITGSSGMAQGLSTTGQQGVLAIQTGSCPAGTEIIISNSEGQQILTLTPQKMFGCMIISTPDIIKGTEYTIHIGGESGTFEAQ